MTTDELIAQEEGLQEQAREVLAALGLLQFLSKFGRPRIVGSVALGLMIWRDIDIDIEIAGEIHDEHFWKAAKHLLAQDQVTLLTLVDNRGLVERDRPPSMYIGVKYLADQRVIWKIDIRFVSEQHAVAHRYIDSVRSNLTADRRGAILGIKSVVAQSTQYGSEISSVDIYEAVLERGVTDPEGFKRHLRDSGRQL